MEIATNGNLIIWEIKSTKKKFLFQYPWTKFVVPSIGSIIHVGSSSNTVLTPEAADSSPINLKFNSI